GYAGFRRFGSARKFSRQLEAGALHPAFTGADSGRTDRDGKVQPERAGRFAGRSRRKGFLARCSGKAGRASRTSPPLGPDIRPMIPLVFAAACAGIFCGASLYVNLVEHPARMSCGTELAVREFAPSYQRATVLQASLALAALLFGLAAAWRASDGIVAGAAAFLGAGGPLPPVGILPPQPHLP